MTAFSALFRFAPQKETSSSLIQLMTFGTCTIKGQNGSYIGGEFSFPLCRWLGSLGQHEIIPEMIQAMKGAYGRMHGGLRDFDNFYFRAFVNDENGWLNVSCPGDACGIQPAHSGTHRGLGYEFSCHNVDTPVQQITLLAGLAALHDRARKEISL